MKKLFVTLAVLSAAFSLSAQNPLTIHVDSPENQTGYLYVALFNSESSFLTSAAETRTVNVDGAIPDVVFESLPAGDYAFVMFFGNGVPDSKNPMAAIMSGRYAFSNNVDPAKILRAPNFAECAVRVDGKAVETSVTLVSLSL